MKKLICIILIFILILSSITIIIEPANSKILNSDTISKSKKFELARLEEPNILKNLNRIDGYFTKNQGQINEDSVKYYIQGKGVWFLDDGVVFEIKESTESTESWSRGGGSRESEEPYGKDFHGPENLGQRNSAVLKLNFEGANAVSAEGIGLLSHKSNYFYGNDSSKWCTNVPNYQEIFYKNLYNNIDLRYYSSDKGLKYEFIVHPGGDPNDIKLSWQNPLALYVDSHSNLIIKSSLGDIVDSEIFIYQESNFEKNQIEGRFNIIDTKTYGFEITTEYDREKELVIDPLVYSTYIGSAGWDVGNSISVDTNGNAYVTGSTEASDFPYTPGAFNTSHNNFYDVFMLKLNHNGSTLMYSTFIGGSDNDNGQDIIVDTSGNVYIQGITNSADFPYTSGAYDTSHNGSSEIFFIKMNPGGNGVNDLLYSTFLGGSSWDNGYSIAIDSSGTAYMTGKTFSSDFPTTTGAYNETYNGSYDVFVAKLDPAGNGPNDLVYSTFIGGNDFEVGNGIAVDSSGNIYITGLATTNFPTTAGAYSNTYNGSNDVFIAKLNPVGAGTSDLVYSTYFGGSQHEEARSIAIDSNNNAYVTGFTWSSNFPTTSGAYDTSFNLGVDIFMFKLNPSGSLPVYSTYIGGLNDDWSYDIAVDLLDNAYITGFTTSTNFPITPAIAYDTTHNGDHDVVVIKLNPTGSTLILSTYIGGVKSDWGYGIAIDPDCRMYVTGATMSSDFPNTPGAYDTSYNLGYDCHVVKIEINYLPYIVDLNVSQSSIYRNNTIYLYSNATDIEDLESELIPTFEYYNAGHISWQNKSLSTSSYINNRWQVSFLLNKTAPIGFYDFRVRYRDKGLLDSDWLYLYKGLKVLNNYPEIEDLTLSKAQAIQKEDISLWVNGNDIEDPERYLTVEVEYRDPSEVKWNTSYLDPVSKKYVGDKWEINFSAPFGAPFGYYDFRANITDSDGNYTGWLPLYNALLISNKNPEFLNVGLSRSKIYRNESVFLYSNCSDYETPEAELSYQAEYKHESDTEWKKLPSNYSEDHWESEFITYIDSELGFYYFRVKFEDSVDESTGWQLLEESLEVLNNPPRISYTLNDLEIGMRAETINLTPFESDVEDTNENLIWSVDETKNYEHLKSVSIIDPLKDLLEIVPEMNVIGDVDIELILTDKDGGTDIRSNITVHVDSTVTETTPKVTLLSPPDESIVNTLTPKLEWKLDNPGDEIITFSVFIDENPNPKTERISGLTKTSYTLEDKLKDGKTYYWWVLPSWGVTLSEPFNFTIDTDFHIEHNVSLTSERSYVSVKQGDSITVNLTVTNEGNVKDTFKIENSSIKLEPAISINKNNIQLDKSSSGMVELSINVALDFELGEYIIYVKAISLGNNSRVDEVNITVEVLSIYFIPNYEVSLEITPTLIEIQQGKSKNITLLIENTGNVADEYYIEFKSDTFGTNVVRIIEDLVFIKPGFIKQVIVTITVPEDMEVTVYTIIFVVKSYKSIDDTELYVNVLKKSDDTNGNDGDEQPQDERENSIVYVGIAIIIIIIILIFLFLYIRKKREEEYLRSIEEEAVKEDKTKPDEKAPTTLPQKIPIAQPMKVDTGGLKPPQLEATPKVPAGVQPAQHVQPQAPTEKPSTTPTIIKSITTQQPPPHP